MLGSGAQNHLSSDAPNPLLPAEKLTRPDATVCYDGGSALPSFPPEYFLLMTSSNLTLHRVLAAAVVVLFASPMTADDVIDFNRDIRPILSENCFHCHGPDAANREADLRLDERQGALYAIEPGERSNSELFARVSTDDDDLRMPPVDSNRQLTKAQIELLGQWIDQGAEWGQHWSWTPLQKPTVPTVPVVDSAPVHNAIDAFIQRQLTEADLAPAPQAPKHTLIRRVTLDLTGLPPTPEDVAAFLQDESPDAYEKLVDRLLRSPAYGERMAWDWLDAARYADSNGYQGDTERTMWPWRDWVIDAFNQNMPYDQFTIEQLAGDLLPEAGFSQQLATGFCRNHMINGEGGRIPEENRVDYVMDMAETTATLWLGLTFNCCRCHDHKFDALTQQDYYSLFAFFNQTPVDGSGRSGQAEPVLAAPTPEQTAQIEKLQTVLAETRNQVAARTQELENSQSDWEQAKLQTLKTQPHWTPVTATRLHADHQTLVQLEDLSIFASGPNPDNDTYVVTAIPGPRKVTGIRLDALRHESHTQGGLARSNSGNFVLTEFEVLHRLGDEQSPIKIASAVATYEQGDLKIAKAFDGNPRSGWAVYQGKPIDRDHAAVFRFAEPVELTDTSELEVTLRHDSPHVSHNLGRFRLSITDADQPELEEGGRQSLQLALLTPKEQRSDEQLKLIRDTFLAEDEQYQKLLKQQQGDEDRLNSARGNVAKVMVMQDQEQPRETFLLNRGLYNNPGDPVSAAVPASLPQLAAGSNRSRLELAQWLMSPENPLTARVVVNRFWQQMFGIGLVKTANDFGVQGEIPIHEDLLNWLAADFRDSGWDVKRLMKTMVMSHTYRQSSAVTPQLVELDPENRLLARAPRYRLPSWMLRDQALAVSGLLTTRMGGPSVNVYQPPGVWEEATFGKKRYVQDHGEALYRRSLYIFWRRIIGPTVFFDNASRQTCTVKVFRTNTPLHALLTFNDVTYVEAARTLAQHVLQSSHETDRERLDDVFQRVLARPARDAEAEILLPGVNRARQEFIAAAESARELVAMGESPRDESLDVTDHAAWTALCLSVLNLDETLSKE